MSGANEPAFPVADAGHGSPWQSGMTLRDWFAGQVLSGLIGRVLDAPFHPGETPGKAALLAYSLADAMLAEREKAGRA